jgi:serine O-acetyltransferase
VLGLRFSTVRKFPYKEVPRIGNNVWIGPNVIVAGPVVIEDNVVIAGNSFVDKSVPAGAIVAGSPAKIIGYTKDLDYDLFANPKDRDGWAPYLVDKKKEQ